MFCIFVLGVVLIGIFCGIASHEVNKDKKE